MRAREGFLALGLLGIGAVLARELLGTPTDDAFTNAELPEPSAAPPETPRACAAPQYFNEYGLFKEVLTPDLTLSSAKNLQEILQGGGWFIIQDGTEWQLARVDADACITLGPKVKDLALLGPASMPEVKRAELESLTPPFRISETPLPDAALRHFFRIENPVAQLPEDFAAGLERRLRTYQVPIEVGSRPVDASAVRTLHERVFDEIQYQKEQPAGMRDGAPCTRGVYADVGVAVTSSGDALTTREYPMLRDAPRDMQEWVRAHELGHALMQIVGAHDAFHSLPAAEREQILTELKALQAALLTEGKPHSHRTANEALAELVAYLMREPSLAMQHAPTAAKFFGTLVDAHPILKSALRIT